MDLNTSLREIAGDPPPSRIDLDALIRAEERRGYRQRRLVGAGVVSGVAVLVGAASVGWPIGSRAPIGDGADPPCPWVSHRGYPSFGYSPFPSYGGATPVPPPSGSMSPFVSPSGGASLPPSVGHSGSPAAPPPSTSASAPVSVPSAGPSVPAGVLGVSPDRSPAETCDDTLRRLEHVLSDALARIAPNAHPATPIRFFNYLDGTVRANVVFDGGGTLIVALSPLWADEFRMWMVYNVLSMGSDGTYWLSYAIGIPRRGVVVADPAASPLTADQLRALADEPGLTLTP